MRIDGRLIGPGQPSLVIAEIGVNHNGSLDRALELVQHAANAGADAVKLQIFRAQTLMNASSKFAEYQRHRVEHSNPSDMLSRYELSSNEFDRLVVAIRDRGLIPLATPFSPSDLDSIERLNLPAIKIASPDLVNRVLLDRAVLSGKPLMLSTGAATADEIEQTVGWLRQWGAEFTLMHCISSYPTPTEQANLCWISELAKFDVPVGYSDHTTNLLAGAMAVALGACILEKHLTYNRNASGPDHAASADPSEFAEYVQLIRSAESLRGTAGRHVLAIEKDVRTVSRQSLVLNRDLGLGDVLRSADLTVQRPGTGIAPAEIAITIGKVARRPLAKGTVLQWDMLMDAA